MSDAYKPMPRQFFIAREGHPFIGIALFGAILFWAAGIPSVGLIFFLLACFIAFFFRNPTRTVPRGDKVIVAPADGRVVEVQRTVSPYTGEDAVKIGTFMSVLNVHINRMPVSAAVQKVSYHPGRFLVASLDKASDENERNGVVLADAGGRKFVVVQVAGLIARRIVCYLKEGVSQKVGDRIGLIRFGSRVDLYVPPDARIEVNVGDKLRAGESVVGSFE